MKVLDLRWLSEVQSAKIAEEIGQSKHVLVVEECRKTGSFSEFLVSAMVEEFGRKSQPLSKIKVVAGDDCFIPLGKASAAGLPKKEEILAGALELLGLELASKTQATSSSKPQGANA